MSDRPAPEPITTRAEFRLGERLHNEGKHYEAHEAWEQLWRQEEDERDRRLVQGLIQVTSAFHKLLVHRMPTGAARLLARGLDKLDSFPDDPPGVDLGAFRRAARLCLARIESMGADATRIDSLAPSEIPPLRRTDGE